MSRKLILTIATAATVAVASLASQSAEAHGGFGGFGRGGFGRGGFGGGHMSSGGFHSARNFRGLLNQHPLQPIIPIAFPKPTPKPTPQPDPHHHWAFHDGKWSFEADVVAVDAPIAVVTAPAPQQTSQCGCLTKTYTPTGLAVFADICTKESASAPVDSTADATQTPTSPVAATAVPISEVPTAPNYAGRTFEDYLAANPQLTQPQAANADAKAAQKN